MYIFFDNNGNETIRYYTKEIPESLKQDRYVEISNIPEKNGHMTRAKLINDEIEWFYEKEEKTLIEELQSENQALRKSSQMSLATIMQLDKKVLELEKKIDEINK